MWMIAIIAFGTIIGGPIGFFIAVGIVIWMQVEKEKTLQGSPGNTQQEQQKSYQQTETTKSEIELLTPCISILRHFALKYEPEWTSEKVRYIKNLFSDICKTSADEIYLRNQLKSTRTPFLSEAISSWLKLNPSQDDRKIIFNAVAILLVNTSNDIGLIEKDSLDFGTIIGLDYRYCQIFLSEILSDRQENQSKSSSGHTESMLEQAAKCLGISVHANIEEIQKAYRLKIKDFHPDRNINVTPAVKEMLQEQARLINDARDILLANK